MKIGKLLLSILSSFCLLSTAADVANAQVREDSSLGTTVTGVGTHVITGGTITPVNGSSVQNLFHSFDEFSLSTGESAVFDLNTMPAVENIFSRVTGGRLSSIDGTLSVEGASANLFLLNPAGIIFGANAQLDLPGSFLATTADRLTFESDSEFSVSELRTPSLLTVSTPTGLQMGADAGQIEVGGNGHTLARLDQSGNPSIVAPNVQIGPTQGLQVLPEQTLTLIGNGLALEGGVLNAPSGNLELGSLAPGAQVEISTEGIVDYSGVDAFRDVSLQQRSLANVSGVAVQLDPNSPVRRFSTEQGRLQVAGRNISLSESSTLLGQSGFAATSPGGPIIVRASEQLLISGSDPTSLARSDISSETIGAGRGGNVQLFAQDLVVEDGGGIISFTASDAENGEIYLQVEDELVVGGINAQNPLLFSTISSVSAAAGNGSDVTVSADKFLLEDGGNTTITIIGSGTGGDINVTADEVFLLGEGVTLSFAPTTISSSSFGSGSAGTVTVDTRRLRMENISTLSATSSGSGFAGDIVVNATERITLIDRTPPSNRNTAITSEVSPSTTSALFGLPNQTPVGDAGSVTINTPTLEMSGNSQVSVQNQGVGNAGTASLQVDNLILKEGSNIRARTLSGTGGNLDLDVSNVLLMRTGSFISTESRSVGDGGNIVIDAPVIVALENSDISADASRGNGGSVNITTQSLLGTAFRERRTPESDITASSEFGLSGSVAINNFRLSPDAGLVELPEQVSDDSDRVAQGCSSSDRNEFIASGRGGLPEAPHRSLFHSRPWMDLRDLAQSSNGFVSSLQNSSGVNGAAATSNISPEDSITLIESTAWQINHLGQIELVTSRSASHSEGPASFDRETCLQQNS